jgi:transglutaminase-like putative cysteine protease
MSAVHYAVRHETLYRYRRDVVHAHQQLHLTPRNSERQHCVLHRIDITPQPAVRRNTWTRSATGSRGSSSTGRITACRWWPRWTCAWMHSRRSTSSRPRLGAVRDQLCYNARARDAEWLEAMRFRGESPYVRIKGVFGDYARDCLLPGASVPSVAAALMTKLWREFTYAPGSTEIATPLLEVLAKRSGVCQDFAHLMIACLRSVGLSARYVSGYLRTHGPAAPPPPTMTT